MSVFQLSNERSGFGLQSLGQIVNGFYAQARTSYATWPVWSDSSDEAI